MTPIKSQIRNAVMTLEVGEQVYVGPFQHSSSVYSSIAKYKANKDCEDGAEFDIKKITGIDSSFTSFHPNIFMIKRIK